MTIAMMSIDDVILRSASAIIVLKGAHMEAKFAVKATGKRLWLGYLALAPAGQYSSPDGWSV